MNIYGILFAYLIPLLLFCAVFATRCFSGTAALLHYVILFCELMVVLAIFWLAYNAWQQKRHGDLSYDPKWYIFLALTALLAYILAVTLGSLNYNANLSYYYSLAPLKDYSSVDPNTMSGQMLQDAGAVYFTDQTKLDINKSMGLAASKTYCVAPITSQSFLTSYDFWAVGVGCCSPLGGDFTCGDYNLANAHAGLRVVKEGAASWFRVAVQKAESTYGIRSVQPLFFTWVVDPVEEHSSYYRDGLIVFLACIAFYAIFQAFLVALACWCFDMVGY